MKNRGDSFERRGTGTRTVWAEAQLMIAAWTPQSLGKSLGWPTQRFTSIPIDWRLLRECSPLIGSSLLNGVQIAMTPGIVGIPNNHEQITHRTLN